jgi:hypothetical protein
MLLNQASARTKAKKGKPAIDLGHSTTRTAAAVYYCTNGLNLHTATDDAAGCSLPTTESFSYDDDANPTSDGTYTYTWDAENP